MKKHKLPILVLVLSLWAWGASAQVDDLYFNPETDAPAVNYSAQQADRSYSGVSERDPRRSGQSFDDDPYDYYYTSRIRRFHRPMYGMGFFDPFYIDSYYYDPFLMPGSTMFIYDSPFAYRRWMRNRAFYDPFFRSRMAFANPFWGFQPGFNVGLGFGFGGFGAPFGFNSFGFGGGFSPFGFGPAAGFAGGGFFGGALYCPPSYGGGYAYNSAFSENTVVSSRPRVNTARSVAPGSGFDRRPSNATRPTVGRAIGRDNAGLRTSDRMREMRRQTGADARSRVRTATRTSPTSRQVRSRTAPSSRVFDRSVRQRSTTRSFRTPTQTRQRTTSPSWNRRQNTSRPSFNRSSRPTVSPRSSGSSRTSAPRSSSSRRSGNNDK